MTSSILFLSVAISLLQLQIFNLVSLIIDRLGEKIVPCVEKILAFLPRVRHCSALDIVVGSFCGKLGGQVSDCC